MKKLYLLLSTLLIGGIILFYTPKVNCLDVTIVSKSIFDSINEVIQEKPLLVFTRYNNDLDTFKSYSSLNYRRMLEQASSNELKLVLKNEMEQWEECSMHLRSLCTNILETNLEGGIYVVVAEVDGVIYTKKVLVK